MLLTCVFFCRSGRQQAGEESIGLRPGSLDPDLVGLEFLKAVRAESVEAQNNLTTVL